MVNCLCTGQRARLLLIRGYLFADINSNLIFRGGTKMLWEFSMCCRNLPFWVYLEGHIEHAKCFCPPHSNLRCFTRLCLIWYDLPHWWQLKIALFLGISPAKPRVATHCSSAKEEWSISIERSWCNQFSNQHQ